MKIDSTVSRKSTYSPCQITVQTYVQTCSKVYEIIMTGTDILLSMIFIDFIACLDAK